MAKEGWIKVFRQMQDCWVWDDKPFAMGQAWVDLLLLTEHSESKKSLKGKPIIVKRGQYLTSIRQLGDRWGWSRTKVLRFLQLLEDDQMIIRESDSQKTLINIVNYGVYQDSELKENDTEKTQKRQQSDTEVTQDREKQEERTKEEVNRDITRMEECKNINNNTPPLSPLGETGNEKAKKKSNADLTREYFNQNLPDYIFTDREIECIRDWIEYKIERKQFYKDRGMKSLLTMFSDHFKDYGEDAVIDVTEQSIANGYQGVTWDRIKEQSKKTQGANITPYTTLKDLEAKQKRG